MKLQQIVVLAVIFSVAFPGSAFPAKDFTEQVQTLDNSITASVYTYKKNKHYVAVEIGFTNPTDKYLEFTPTEIYLDDAITYSKPPLSVAEIQSIEAKRADLSIIPGALAVGLGLATIGTGIYGQNAATKALGVAALGAGGAYLLTKTLSNQAQNNRLIKFENNSLDAIKRLPPGMTLGGYMYFPSTKNPKSITIVARAKNGKYERLTFDLMNVKQPKIRNKSQRKDR